MTNNTDTLTIASSSRDVINRQLNGCYKILSANKAIIKASAFLDDTPDVREAIANAKESIIRTEGRIAGLIFARDEVFLPKA